MVSAILLSALGVLVTTAEPLTFTTVHASEPEVATVAQLQRLLAEHDAARWTFTRAVSVDQDAIPHSHPVLTLHTRHLRDDVLLLSTYVHEQFHWHLDAHRKQTDAAVADLRKRYPKVPVGHPDGGFNERSTYEHLMVCLLEYEALIRMVGELRAFQAMQFWAQDHYRWVYTKVLSEGPGIRAVMQAHGVGLP
jgi:hypothetical protein